MTRRSVTIACRLLSPVKLLPTAAAWTLSTGDEASSGALRRHLSALAQPAPQEPVKPFKDIPGPESLPFLGNFLNFYHPQFGRDPKYALQTMEYIYRKHGKIVRVEIPLRPPLVLMYDPAYCEKVYRAVGAQPIRPGFDSLDYVQKRVRKDIEDSKRGLLVTHKNNWRDFRSLVQKPMLRPSSGTSYISVLDGIAQEFIDMRIRRIRNEQGETPEDFLQELYRWALESVALLALNTRLGCLEPSSNQDSEQRRLIDAVSDIFRLNHKLDNGPQLWRFSPIQGPKMARFEKAYRVFYEIASQHISRSLASLETEGNSDNKEKTLLELFKEAGADTDTATTMALDMLFAGIDTSSHTIAFCLYHLARTPGVQEKLFHEINTKVKPEGLDKETLEQLPYLKAVVKESLRFASPAGANARLLEEDLVVGGYQVPKGSVMVMCHHTMSNSEEFISNPKSFCPERWIKSSDQYEVLHSFVNLPFGHGARMCIGRRFAELEVYILLTKLMQNFRVEWHQADLPIITHLISKPGAPLKYRLIDRQRTSQL